MKLRLSAFWVLFLLTAADLSAAQVLSNLGIGYNSSFSQYIGNNTYGGSEKVSYLGSSFVVGSTGSGSWNLDSVTLRMEDSQDPTTNEPFTVAIYANNGGLPGTRLGALSGNANPITANDYTFTAAQGSIILTAGAEYWLVAEAPGTTTFQHTYQWAVANGTGFTTQSAGWSVDDAHAMAQFNAGYLSDNGSWTDFVNPPLDNVVWSSGDIGGYLAFALSATAVVGAPEPSKAVLVLLGVLSLGLRRRHRR